MTNYISYYRVSTQKQGETELGLEAQKSSVKAFLSKQDNLIAEYQEVESGKKNNRLELFKEVLIDVYKSNQSNRINSVKKLKKQKILIEEKLDNLTEKYVNDSIDRESYNRLKNKYKEQIQRTNK